MNKFISIALAITALLLSSVYAYLYVTPDSTSNNSKALSNVENIYGLREIDAAWSLATLQTLSTVESDFDKVAAFLPKFREMRNQLRKSELASNDVPTQLQNKLFAFLSMLEGKELAIEKFKSNLAVTRNSLKYLPLATITLTNDLKKLKNLLLAKRIQSVNEQVNAYLNAPDGAIQKQLFININSLYKNITDLPEDTANDIRNYISHLSLLVERKIPMDIIIARVTDNTVVKSGADLLDSYKIYLSEKQDELDARNYKTNLYKTSISMALAILAVIACIYSIFCSVRLDQQLRKQ